MGLDRQTTIGYDKDRANILLSMLHKYIRRSRPVQAMLAGLELFEMSPPQFWGEVKTIAVEDVAQPLEIAAVGTLYSQWKELSKENQLGKGRLWAMDAMKILAEAKKDRRADEILHLLKVQGFEPARRLLQLEPPVPDSVINDKHTLSGKRAGRGELHFVTEASRCENMSPEYEQWTEMWVEVMRKASEWNERILG